VQAHPQDSEYGKYS